MVFDIFFSSSETESYELSIKLFKFLINEKNRYFEEQSK